MTTINASRDMLNNSNLPVFLYKCDTMNLLNHSITRGVEPSPPPPQRFFFDNFSKKKLFSGFLFFDIFWDIFYKWKGNLSQECVKRGLLSFQSKIGTIAPDFAGKMRVFCFTSKHREREQKSPLK